MVALQGCVRASHALCPHPTPPHAPPLRPLTSVRRADNRTWTRVDNASTHALHFTLADVGCWLQCECTPCSGSVEGAPVVATCGPVVAAEPAASSVRLRGQTLHTGELFVDWDYVGGREGATTIQWQRSVDGKSFRNLGPPQAHRNLPLSVDDVNCYIQAVVTPVRADGAVGLPVSVRSACITMDPDILQGTF